MGIIKRGDILGWKHEGAYYCLEHGDRGCDDIPMTEDDFNYDDVVTCDFHDGVKLCNERIC